MMDEIARAREREGRTGMRSIMDERAVKADVRPAIKSNMEIARFSSLSLFLVYPKKMSMVSTICLSSLSEDNLLITYGTSVISRLMTLASNVDRTSCKSSGLLGKYFSSIQTGVNHLTRPLLLLE